MALFAVFSYGAELSLPFIGDDYVFLDAAQRSNPTQLFSFRNVDFGWYRPWSREVHFYTLLNVFGPAPLFFRLVGIVLWLGSVILYWRLLVHILSPRASTIAAFAVGALALWGTPLLWISGSQDLWMLFFGLACLNLYSSGRHLLSAAFLVLALLSKETAGMFPILLTAYSLMIDGNSFKTALRRSALHYGIVVAWALVHPTLLHRFTTDHSHTPELEHRPAFAVVVLRTLLSTINLDVFPRPFEVTEIDVLRVALGCLSIAVAAAFLLAAKAKGPSATSSTPPSRQQALRFGLAWTAIGWCPVFLPSIGWHAYYGCLGALGAWIVLSLILERGSRSLVIAALVSLALLRGAQGKTLSWDWGQPWYQSRAGHLLEAIQGRLLELHPTLPHRTHLFFGRIPNNIGFIAGRSPAVRVWYRDTTLRADFYSSYTSYRSRPGYADLFFRFDSIRVLVEIKAGHEDVVRHLADNPQWELDHVNLAMLFLQQGDADRAAVEFEKVATLPHRSDELLFAGVCRELIADSARSDSLYKLAAVRQGRPLPEVLASARELLLTVPTPTPSRR